MVSACGPEKATYRNTGRITTLPSYAADRQPTQEFVRAPWELWSYGRDLKGDQITSPAIIRGDQTLRTGDRAGALNAYKEALTQNLSHAEREALMFRIAGVELALDKPNDVLVRLSDYFRNQRATIADVPPRFGLLFGYAYGRAGDYLQAVSWFSRAKEISTGSLSAATEAALGRLLSTATDEKLNELNASWSGDLFVNGKIGEERARRASSDAHSILTTKRAFWEEYEDSDAPPIEVAAVQTTIGKKVGVLLPLSGQYADLGTSIKNGIDLAVAGSASQGETVTMVLRDSGSAPIEAVTQAEHLISVEQVGVLIGPLLTEEAVAVGETARSRGIPMVAFSKKSDFPVGDPIFRLAPTAEAQVDSLLRGVHDMLDLKRVAIVYPDDATGKEFAAMFRKRAIDRGLNIVYESSYPKGQVEALIERAKEVEKSRTQGVFFPDNLSVAVQFFSSIGESARKRMRPLGLANWDSPADLIHSATVFEGAVFVSPFFRQSSRPIVNQFNAIYQSKYGTQPDFLAAQGFDAATMTIAALGREREDGTPFTEAMKGIEGYEGLTGVIHADLAGDLVPSFAVIQLVGGIFSELGGPAPVPKPEFTVEIGSTKTRASLPVSEGVLGVESTVATPSATPTSGLPAETSAAEPIAASSTVATSEEDTHATTH